MTDEEIQRAADRAVRIARNAFDAAYPIKPSGDALLAVSRLATRLLDFLGPDEGEPI